jgi:hypothetical protein
MASVPHRVGNLEETKMFGLGMKTVKVWEMVRVKEMEAVLGLERALEKGE